jgi:hypothetical protein
MKEKATITLDPKLWQQFRMACLERKASASNIIGTLIRWQLARWNNKEKTK